MQKCREVLSHEVDTRWRQTLNILLCVALRGVVMSWLMSIQDGCMMVDLFMLTKIKAILLQQQLPCC